MEEQDRLKGFVNQNRESFDDKGPSDRVWQKIEVDLANSNPMNIEKRHPYLAIWKVAAVFFFFATSVLLVMKWQEPATMVVDNGQQVDEFEMAEAYYMKVIGQKQAELSMSLTISPELANKFDRDLEVLDSLYQQLKRDIQAKGDASKVQDAMVQNLRLRIEILNYQLDILEKVKTTKDNENEANI